MIAAAHHELPTIQEVKLQAERIMIPDCGGICPLSIIYH